jgi:hypothetical protein
VDDRLCSAIPHAGSGRQIPGLGDLFRSTLGRATGVTAATGLEFQVSGVRPQDRYWSIVVARARMKLLTKLRNTISSADAEKHLPLEQWRIAR